MSEKKMGIGVGVMLLRDGAVLLGKRHDEPEKADSELNGEGTWTMPGGKFNFGEEFEDVACREAEEETGIRLAPDDLRVISISNDVVSDAHFVTIGLLCEGVQQEPEVKEPDEITEWRWFPLNALPDLLFSPSEKIIKNYKAGVFYK